MEKGKPRNNSSTELELDALVLMWELLIHIYTDMEIITDVDVCILIYMYAHVYTYIYFQLHLLK